MVVRIVAILGLVVALSLALTYAVGRGWLGESWDAGSVTEARVPAEVLSSRSAALRSAALGARVEAPRRILFGDLHVHTTFSLDAFMMSMPLAGGEGAHPVADACDFARYCAGVDFWSVNDHAITSTPRRWRETVESIRQCEAAAGEEHDVIPFLGWEWTQIGSTPDNHYGHKNVVLRDLGDDQIPTRPIAALSPANAFDGAPGPLSTGLLVIASMQPAYLDVPTYFEESAAVPVCEEGVRVRDLPDDCREMAATPADLFAKLDDWGHASMVIPHGTSWGIYTPPGSAWDKQLTPSFHDPKRQGLIEVYSGHGNSEEYRDWRAVRFAPDGARTCPEPRPDYLPSCWQAGEIIRDRCRAAGESEAECDARAIVARQHAVDALAVWGHRAVPGAKPAEWLDSGQCRDCFQGAFNHRPMSSVQSIMALGREDQTGRPLRFRFGFIASSDNHSARPGTGYKEVARTAFTDTRLGTLGIPTGPPPEPEAISRTVDIKDVLPMDRVESERSASFLLTGGLVAVHAEARNRGAVWDALERREVYGTSGPRILLWFDLMDPASGALLPMGSETAQATAPRFEVRAVGSREQQPGCPDWAETALGPERLARMCRGECYHPSDRRRPITRIEVVRIRPQERDDEPIGDLVEDPWRVLPCPGDGNGCTAIFTDDEFPDAARDTLYYARAIEAASPTINAGGLRCEGDAGGACTRTRPCVGVPDSDACHEASEHRAWSSPIFVDFAATGSTGDAGALAANAEKQ